MTNDANESFLTTRELAERWKCALRTLQRWRTSGTGPRYHRIQGRVLYALSDVRAHEETSRSDPKR